MKGDNLLSFSSRCTTPWSQFGVSVTGGVADVDQRSIKARL